MRTQQCKWYDTENEMWHGGILVDDTYIICGCCGGVIELVDEPNIQIEKYKAWIDLDEAIIGD